MSRYLSRLTNYSAYECAVVVLSSAVAWRGRYNNELFSFAKRKVYLIVAGSGAADFDWRNAIGAQFLNRNRCGIVSAHSGFPPIKEI
jgi:hypothetical protein